MTTELENKEEEVNRAERRYKRLLQRSITAGIIFDETSEEADRRLAVQASTKALVALGALKRLQKELVHAPQANVQPSYDDHDDEEEYKPTNGRGYVPLRWILAAPVSFIAVVVMGLLLSGK